MSEAGAVVRAFVDAFNAEDLDALERTISEDVEIQSTRGLVVGREEARRWATRRPSGALHQRLVLDEIEEGEAHVLALLRRQWVWRVEEHAGEVADERRIHYVATIRHGLICRWQPFEDGAEAARVAGVSRD